MIDTLNAIYPHLGSALLGAAIGLAATVIIGLLLRRWLKRRRNQEPAP